MPLLLFCVFLFPLLFVSPPNQLLRSDAMIPPNDLHRFNLVCVFGCVCVHVCVFQRATARVISSLVAMVCVGLRERERERERKRQASRGRRGAFFKLVSMLPVCEREREREKAQESARAREGEEVFEPSVLCLFVCNRERTEWARSCSSDRMQERAKVRKRKQDWAREE